MGREIWYPTLVGTPTFIDLYKVLLLHYPIIILSYRYII